MIDYSMMGIRLRQARKRQGLSQQQVEDKAGISLRTIRRCEQSGTTSLSTLDTLCDVYDVSINEILGGHDDIRRLLNAFDRLGPNSKSLVNSFIRAVQESEKESAPT